MEINDRCCVYLYVHLHFFSLIVLWSVCYINDIGHQDYNRTNVNGMMFVIS